MLLAMKKALDSQDQDGLLLLSSMVRQSLSSEPNDDIVIVPDTSMVEAKSTSPETSMVEAKSTSPKTNALTTPDPP